MTPNIRKENNIENFIKENLYTGGGHSNYQINESSNKYNHNQEQVQNDNNYNQYYGYISNLNNRTPLNIKIPPKIEENGYIFQNERQGNDKFLANEKCFVPLPNYNQVNLNNISHSHPNQLHKVNMNSIYNSNDNIGIDLMSKFNDMTVGYKSINMSNVDNKSDVRSINNLNNVGFHSTKNSNRKVINYGFNQNTNGIHNESFKKYTSRVEEDIEEDKIKTILLNSNQNMSNISNFSYMSNQKGRITSRRDDVNSKFIKFNILIL